MGVFGICALHETDSARAALGYCCCDPCLDHSADSAFSVCFSNEETAAALRHELNFSGRELFLVRAAEKAAGAREGKSEEVIFFSEYSVIEKIWDGFPDVL
jgi:hypothetical protein